MYIILQDTFWEIFSENCFQIQLSNPYVCVCVCVLGQAGKCKQSTNVKTRSKHADDERGLQTAGGERLCLRTQLPRLGPPSLPSSPAPRGQPASRLTRSLPVWR